MKRTLSIAIALGILYAIFNSFAYAYSLDYAIIPRFIVPIAFIVSCIIKAPLFIGISLLAIGLALFFFSIYLFMMIIHKRTKSWWKTFYFTFVISFSLGFALLSRPLLDFLMFYPPLNLALVGVLIFSTILLFPLKQFRYLILQYAIYLIAYFLLVGIFYHGFFALSGWILYLTPLSVILLFILTFRFLTNRNIIYFLVLIIFFVPLRIMWECKYGFLKESTKKVEYTMIAPSDGFHEVKEFEIPSDNPLLFYISILELDSAFNAPRSIYGQSYFFSLYFFFNLNEERVIRIEKLLNDESLYVGQRWRERIKKKIIDRWENKEERGVISGKFTGDIPDRIGLIEHKDMGFRWVFSYMKANVKDVVSPDKNGNFEFGYVPEGEYDFLLLYKRCVPQYEANIPTITSKNDTINLGDIKIE